MSHVSASQLHAPETISPEKAALVREHLEKILASATLKGSRRTQDFLRLVVSHALEGDSDNLRERMIGAELFHRPVGYDTGNDSVVRVRASEVRRKLAQYYDEEIRGEKPAVRIEIPTGSYIPQFLFEQEKPLVGEPAAVSPAVKESGLPFSAPVTAIAAEPSLETASAIARPVSPPRLPGLAARVPLIVTAACLVIALAAYFAWRKSRSAAVAPAAIHSIAVLPFENLSGTPSQDYFADGLTEELINDLGQVSTLRVISFTSSMSFRGTQKRLPEIARELSVDGVVEGGVLRDGNDVRISVQLIDARTDRPVWASSYVQDITGVFAWQGEVAQDIAEEIKTEVTPQEQARLQRQQRRVDPQAQDLYLHGLLMRNAAQCGRAVDYFRRAILMSPDYAQAHSALASCYGFLGESGQMPYHQAFTLQSEEAQKAIALDDSLSEAHAELANTEMTLDWNWPEAQAEFRRALELNPNSATSHEKYAFYLVRTGQPREAISQIQKSVELDPISGSTFHAEGFIYYFAHQYDQALAVTRTVQGFDVPLPDWNFLLGDIEVEKGNYPQAVAAFLKSGDGPYSLGHLGNAYARMGRSAEAKKLIGPLQEDVRRDGIGRYEIALVYAGLGEKDAAFKWLDDAYRFHDVGLVYLKVDPCLNPLRSDPRFSDLLRRVGLAPQ